MLIAREFARGVIFEKSNERRGQQRQAREGEGDVQMTQLFTNGYAMKIEFGSVAADKMTGKIYLCLPDVSKSFVAGSFNAEIRKLAFPKQP